MDSKKFKAVVMAVARSCDAEVAAVYEPAATPNFLAAELCIRHSDQKLYLLCSANDDTWAISEFFEPNTCKLRFVDEPLISRALEHVAGTVPLDSRALNGPFSPRAYMVTSDIAYWKPKTLGEGLFNWWD